MHYISFLKEKEIEVKECLYNLFWSILTHF